MSALGKLVVSLSLEHAAFTKGLDKSSQESLRFAKNSQDSFDKFERSTSAAFSNAVKSAGSAAVAFLSVSAAISQLTQSLKFADEINDIAKANEVAVSSVLKLSQALSLNGGEASNASKLLSSLTQSIDSAAQGSAETQKRFASLGISLNDLRKLDGEQILDKTLQSLVAINDPIERNAAAMDLLGKAVKGVDINGLGSDFASNQKNFTEAEKAFKDIGETFDKIDSVSTNLKTSLATLFGPTILSAIQSFAEYVEAINFTMANGTGFEKMRMILLGNRSERLGELQKRFPGRTDLQSQSGKIKFSSVSGEATGADRRTVVDALAEAAAEKAKQAREKADREAKSRADNAAKDAKDEALRVSQAMAKNMADEMENYKKRAEERKKLSDKAAEDEKDRIEKVMQYQQDLANKNFDEAQRQAKELADIQQRENEQIGRELSQALTNGLFDSFKKGESFGTAMVRNIVAFGQTWFARMFEGLLTSGFGSITSLFSGSASAGASSGGGITGTLSSIGDIFKSGNDSLVRGIESLGSFLSTGNGGLGDVLGGAIGQYSNQIANVLPFAGTAFSLLTGDTKGAIGSALGAALSFTPLGAAGGIVGSLLGGALGGVFGGGHVSRPKFYNNSTVSSAGVKSFNSYGNNDASGKNVAKTAGGSIGNQIAAYASAFGGSLNPFTLGTTFSQKYNTYGISIGNKIAKDGTNRDVAFNPKTAGLQEKAIAQSFLIAMQKGFVNLPDYLVDIVKKSSLKRDEALTNIQTLSGIKSLKDSLAGLPPVFDAINYSIGQVTLATAGGLSTQFANVQKYTELFYSADEQFATFTKQLTAQTAALGIALPTSRDAYRALVDGIKVTDTSTSNLFNGLVGLAPAMDAYFKQLEAQNEILKDNAALLDANNFKTQFDYNFYKGLADNYGNKFANDYNAGGAVSYGMNVGAGISAPSQGNNVTMTVTDPNTLSVMSALVEKVNALQIALDKTQANTKRTADILTLVTPDGDAIETRPA